MAEISSCPKCGTVLPGDAVSGVCPQCLMRVGLGSSSEFNSLGLAATTPMSDSFVPFDPDDLAEYFPQLEILELLGHGGMGAVYKARQKKLDRLVALKIIRPESASDPAFAERFNREARTLARLNHPAIVGVHDFGDVRVNSDSGRLLIEVDRGQRATPTPGDNAAGSAAAGPEHILYFFLMEYVDGVNLRQLMQSQSVSPEQTLLIIARICEGLQFAHQEGVIHRDIKPENIMIERCEQTGLDPGLFRVKITDFGLAKLAEQPPDHFTLTGTHQVMGTPRYMAPEQMGGSRNVDHRADIYSLGVLFYELLTGELPMGQFEPPSGMTDVDPRLDDVVMRTLARDRNADFRPLAN